MNVNGLTPATQTEIETVNNGFTPTPDEEKWIETILTDLGTVKADFQNIANDLKNGKDPTNDMTTLANDLDKEIEAEGSAWYEFGQDGGAKDQSWFNSNITNPMYNSIWGMKNNNGITLQDFENNAPLMLVILQYNMQTPEQAEGFAQSAQNIMNNLENYANS